VAVRDRPSGLRGPLRSWVTRAEAHQLAEELATVESTEELEEWAYRTELRPPHGVLRAGRYTVKALAARADGRSVSLTPGERAQVTREALVELAAKRRHEAVVEYAVEHGLAVPVAVGADGSGRQLARCPTCNAPVELLPFSRHIYCREHQAAEQAEVAELLGASA
jgi:hypothetical protein